MSAPSVLSIKTCRVTEQMGTEGGWPVGPGQWEGQSARGNFGHGKFCKMARGCLAEATVEVTTGFGSRWSWLPPS